MTYTWTVTNQKTDEYKKNGLLQYARTQIIVQATLTSANC